MLAARLQDERRLVRALEVWELTGRPFTSFMPRREHVEPTVQIGLDLERAALHDRLARRVGAMVEAGLETEVRALAARGLREGRTASRALGYGQFLDVVDGRATVAEAVEATVVDRGRERAISGEGNGPVSAFVDAVSALGYHVRVLDYA